MTRSIWRDENGILRVPYIRHSEFRANAEQRLFKRYIEGYIPYTQVISEMCRLENIEPFTQEELHEIMNGVGWCI